MRVIQINLQQLSILGRSIKFTTSGNKEVQKASIKRFLKMVLSKSSSDKFDTP